MQQIIIAVHQSQCVIQFEELRTTGFCGKNGTTNHKREGDGKTPLGCFPIRFGFYRQERPVTKLPMVKIHPRHIWIDDPISPLYNRLTFGGTSARGEVLWEYPYEYALGLVIEYNRFPVIKGKGSAIFMHCGNQPTAGCIAVEKSFLQQVIERITPNQNPSILIYCREGCCAK